MPPIRVKICCIQNEDEAALAIRVGAHAVGLVGRMPSGPGMISDAQIHRLAKQIPPGLSTFLLTSETKAPAIIDHHRRTHTTVIQLVDLLPPAEYTFLRKEIFGIKLVQVIHVWGEPSIQQAQQYAGLADALLLDSGNPNLPTKELGGTGRVHDWQLSARIVQAVDIPVYLAGGLNPGNVAEAIRQVQPFGVDVCSGVRTNGKLDTEKVENFMLAVYNSLTR